MTAPGPKRLRYFAYWESCCCLHMVQVMLQRRIKPRAEKSSHSQRCKRMNHTHSKEKEPHHVQACVPVWGCGEGHFSSRENSHMVALAAKHGLAVYPGHNLALHQDRHLHPSSWLRGHINSRLLCNYSCISSGCQETYSCRLVHVHRPC